MEQVPRKVAKTDKSDENRQKLDDGRPRHHARDVAQSCHPSTMGPCHLV